MCVEVLFALIAAEKKSDRSSRQHVGDGEEGLILNHLYLNRAVVNHGVIKCFQVNNICFVCFSF